MGIPKLSRDLERYRRTVVVGSSASSSDLDHVTSLVIDGPGLVYFVYNRLLATKSPVANPLDNQLSYAEICKAVRSLLIAIRDQGVDM